MWAIVVVLMALVVPPVSVVPPALVVPPAPPESAIYVVVLGGGVESEAVTERHGVVARRAYFTALRGFSAAMTPAQAATLARDPAVVHVQRSIVHRATDT